MVDVRGSVKLFGIMISSPVGDDISRIVAEGGGGGKDEKKFQNTPTSEVEKNERNTSEPEMENAETKVVEEDEHKDMCDSQAEPPIKQDKILQCPRCDSLDTKFCYYNNYNFNQRRHFCKKCQRYWTAGGSMRNVPVGSGRRKNKNSLPTCRQTTLSDSSLKLETPELECFDFQNPLSSTKPLVYYTVSPFWLAPMSLESRPNSSPLGKHSRESAILTSQNPKKQIKGNGTCVWIPNTLRIDHNPIEASMSSVWTTIGVNNQKAGGFHNAFGPKTNYNGRAIETIHRVSHANPAAMSRSIKFQENM